MVTKTGKHARGPGPPTPALVLALALAPTPAHKHHNPPSSKDTYTIKTLMGLFVVQFSPAKQGAKARHVLEICDVPTPLVTSYTSIVRNAGVLEDDNAHLKLIKS